MAPHELKWKFPIPELPPRWTVNFANHITQEIYSTTDVNSLGDLPRKGDQIVSEVDHPTKPFVEYEVRRILINYDTHEAWVLLEAQHHREYRYYSELID